MGHEDENRMMFETPPLPQPEPDPDIEHDLDVAEAMYLNACNTPRYRAAVARFVARLFGRAR